MGAFPAGSGRLSQRGGISMARKRDYYEILGIPKNADADTIKKAYRKLAKKYHPDTNKGNPSADEKFKEVTEAYEVLRDTEKRKLYDRFGMVAFDGSMDAGAYQSSEQADAGYRTYHFEGDDMEELFRNIFGGEFKTGRKGGFGTAFDDYGFTHRSHRGEDVTAQIHIDFDEAVTGCSKIISYQDENGMKQSLRVNIPAGIDTGKKIRLQGKGVAGANGGAAGDLYLEVIVGKKAGFERKGQDIYTTVQIPYATAVLGGEAIVPTLYGDVRCQIKEGTQSGTKIRLRGKGIVSMDHPASKGDQYVTVEIQVPRALNPEAKQKLREYQQAV